MNIFATEYQDKSKVFYLNRVYSIRCSSCGAAKGDGNIAEVCVTELAMADNDGNPCAPFRKTSRYLFNRGQLFALYREIGLELQRVIESESR